MTKPWVSTTLLILPNYLIVFKKTIDFKFAAHFSKERVQMALVSLAV